MLTQKQKKLKKQIDNLKLKVQQATRAYFSKKNECKDHFIYSTQYGGAECSICKGHLGWYCPKSSDHICKYVNSEHCKYCDEPEERK